MRVSVGPERLLGACLIAKPRRGAWAGVPLIALPPSPPTSSAQGIEEQIVSLSQLALHAQGSPLVLAPRARKATPSGATSSSACCCAAEESSCQPTPPSTPDSGGSQASDEPAPLPRVLKPRKRRKRERAASAPGPGLGLGPGPPNAPSALCACALCRAPVGASSSAPPTFSLTGYPTPPVSPLQGRLGRDCWDDAGYKCECHDGSGGCGRAGVQTRSFGPVICTPLHPLVKFGPVSCTPLTRSLADFESSLAVDSFL